MVLPFQSNKTPPLKYFLWSQRKKKKNPIRRSLIKCSSFFANWNLLKRSRSNFKKTLWRSLWLNIRNFKHMSWGCALTSCTFENYRDATIKHCPLTSKAGHTHILTCVHTHAHTLLNLSHVESFITGPRQHCAEEQKKEIIIVIFTLCTSLNLSLFLTYKHKIKQSSSMPWNRRSCWTHLQAPPDERWLHWQSRHDQAACRGSDVMWCPRYTQI